MHTAHTGTRRTVHPRSTVAPPGLLDAPLPHPYRRGMTAAEQTLEDAVERVRELALRLWAVREAHPAHRTLLGGLRCRACGVAFPCPTVRATQP